MEPQYHCVPNFGWCMVGCPRIEHPAYVRILNCLSHHLMSRARTCKDVVIVRSFTWLLISDSMNWRTLKLHKIAGTVSYNPVVDTCITLHTHKGIVDSIGVLVVDVVLLLMMLIGLLRHGNGASIGIWKLLYQQVTLKTFSPACDGCWVRSSV